jgi:hypothetical protein
MLTATRFEQQLENSVEVMFANNIIIPFSDIESMSFAVIKIESNEN